MEKNLVTSAVCGCINYCIGAVLSPKIRSACFCLVSSSPGFANDILRSDIRVTSVALPYYNTEVVPSQIG